MFLFTRSSPDGGMCVMVRGIHYVSTGSSGYNTSRVPLFYLGSLSVSGVHHSRVIPHEPDDVELFGGACV